MSIYPRAFPRRGEVYWVDFGSTEGSEQAGHRPAVVVSNDVNNEHSSVVTIAAVTRTEPRKPYPFLVRVPAGVLRHDSTVLCNQLNTVAKSRLQRFEGQLEREYIEQIDRALAVSLALRG